MLAKPIYFLLSLGLIICGHYSDVQAQDFDYVEKERDVLSSAGRQALPTPLGYSYPFTVGEVNVAASFDHSSYGDLDFSVGFQQPDIVTIPTLEVYSSSTESQCPGYRDGSIIINYEGCINPFTIHIKGSGLDTTIDKIEASAMHTFDNLDSGTYIITVRGSNFCTFIDTQRVELKNNTCDVVKYTGITPNGDGQNDVWIIDNMEIYPNNTVTLYSRWGVKVWSRANYDNENVVWAGEGDNGQDLPGGTYFYVIEVDDYPSGSGSGWIQLTR